MGMGGPLTEEDDDEDEVSVELNRTDKECHNCQDPLLYADEVFSFTVAKVQVIPDGVTYPPLATEDGLDLLYSTFFVCISCYENAKEDLSEEYADIPPIEDEFSVLECCGCASGIRDGETVVVPCFGEIHLSNRSPNGVPGGDKFEVMDPDPDILCIACANFLNDDLLPDLWPITLRQINECREGTFARCWRYGCDAQGDCDNCEQENA